MEMKGMVYTSFALLASALLLSLAFAPLSTTGESTPTNTIRIGQTGFFLDSVLTDLDRSLGLATRRALTSSTNNVLVNNRTLVDPRSNISSALVNGTIGGEDLAGMEDVSINEWTQRVKNISDSSGYRLSIELNSFNFEARNLSVESSYRVEANLSDPVTNTRFSRSRISNSTSTVEGLEDPLLALRSDGAINRQYERCEFDQPVEKLTAADYGHNNSVRGPASVEPSDLSAVESASRKILVVEDVDTYSKPEVESFLGVVSEQPNSSSGYSNHYVFNTDEELNLSNGQTVILDEDHVWRSDLETMFGEDGCYVPDSLGPDPVERLGGSLVSSGDAGAATLIDVSKLPSELERQGSAVGYVYFNETGDYGDSKRIESISDEYEWFRLDQEHVDLWNADGLVK